MRDDAYDWSDEFGFPAWEIGYHHFAGDIDVYDAYVDILSRIGGGVEPDPGHPGYVLLIVDPALFEGNALERYLEKAGYPIDDTPMQVLEYLRS